jgi:RimJ/RimL family protein N-acetyltransferase
MELIPYGEQDRWLTAATDGDAEMMSHLGGPVDAEEVDRLHRRRADDVAAGQWFFTIVPEPDEPAAGTIGIWPSDWRGERIWETGWCVLPAHQGKGIAGRALELLLERARKDGSMDRIHAFPGVTNGPSNALCQRSGFVDAGDHDLDYRGRQLRITDWVLDLTP